MTESGPVTGASVATPVLAVVGRPNVGKSTLVNRIIGRREAVVEDVPGVTRDRVSYDATWNGRAFTVVDTGGWDPDARGLAERIAGQAEIAVTLADAVLFVVDATVGITDHDEAVVKILRKSGKPVVLAANHVGWLDGPMLGIYSPRPVHALTKREMFSGGMDRFLRSSGQIPVDRFAPDPLAIKAFLRVLRDGGVAGIFPEGARGTGELELFKRGTAYLALVTGAPVVPVSLFGTREPGQDSHSRPARGAAPIDVVFGEPWQVAAQPWPRRKDMVDQASAALRTHMLRTLAEAKTITGRELPGPLPAGDSERDAARRQATT